VAFDIEKAESLRVVNKHVYENRRDQKSLLCIRGSRRVLAFAALKTLFLFLEFLFPCGGFCRCLCIGICGLGS